MELVTRVDFVFTTINGVIVIAILIKKNSKSQLIKKFRLGFHPTESFMLFCFFLTLEAVNMM